MHPRLNFLCAVVLTIFAAPASAQSPTRGEDFLLRATTHPIRFHLSLPPGYDAQSRKWPVLVCLAGADSDFQVHLDRYASVRGRVPFLVVAPCTVSSTNAIEGSHREFYRGLYSEKVLRDAERNRLAWDESGLLAILTDLRRDFGADDRVVITGFSGGGLLTYRMLLAHPDQLRVAVPVCANYFGDTGPTDPTPLSAREKALPVRIVVGEFDRRLGGGRSPERTPRSPWLLPALAAAVLGAAYLVLRRMKRAGSVRVWIAIVVAVSGVGATVLIKSRNNELIDPQTRAAVQQLEARGYTNVTVAVVPGMGHTLAPERVVEVFNDIP